MTTPRRADLSDEDVRAGVVWAARGRTAPDGTLWQPEAGALRVPRGRAPHRGGIKISEKQFPTAESPPGKICAFGLAYDGASPRYPLELRAPAPARSADRRCRPAAGVGLAVIGTGGDPGHAPARAMYEKLNFNAFRHVRYYRKL